jgi:hypothetical protein
MKELFKALADFQQECPIIAKEGTAKVHTKSGKDYSYNYADLPAIAEIIMPLMKKHKLGFYQPLRYTDGVRKLATIIFHTETGNSIESEIDIPTVEFIGMNDYQSLGSGITYLRRYTLSSALGIVTDEDTDAVGEQSKPQTKKYPEKKELPWLSEKAFNSAVSRIQGAKPNVLIEEDGNQLELTPAEFVDKLVAEFRMKKDYKTALLHEVEFQNTLSTAPEKPQDVTPEIPY